MRESEENVIDFSTHLFADLNKQLAQEKIAKQKLVHALRDIKSLQRKITKSIESVVRCNYLDDFFAMVCNDLHLTFSCDVVRLGVESELMSEYESYYSENNYSGLSFLPLSYCAAIFTDKNHIIINDDKSTKQHHFKQIIFSDCNGLAKSSLHLRLHLPSSNRDAVLAFGAKESNFFTEKKYDFELIGLMTQVVAVTLNRLLEQEAGLL